MSYRPEGLFSRTATPLITIRCGVLAIARTIFIYHLNAQSDITCKKAPHIISYVEIFDKSDSNRRQCYQHSLRTVSACLSVSKLT